MTLPISICFELCMILSTRVLDLGLTIISHLVAKFLLLHQKRLLLLAFYIDDLFLIVVLTRKKQTIQSIDYDNLDIFTKSF